MRFRDALHRRAFRPGRRLVLAEGWDSRVSRAAQYVSDRGVEVRLLTPDHVTSAPELDAVAARLRERKPDRVADHRQARDLASDPIRFAAGLVGLRHADAAVAGATCPTADVLRAAIWLVGPATGITVVSSAFYMLLGPTADAGVGGEARVLTFTDAGVIPDPTAEELVEIAGAAAADRRRIVGDQPRVAFLSFSTKGSATGPRVDKVRTAAEQFRAGWPEIPSDGELQGDAALVPEIAARKAAGSPLDGRANILVFPDLDSGNIAYKLVNRLAGGTAIGPILQGLAKPVADVSRGASPSDIADVAAVAVLQAARLNR